MFPKHKLCYYNKLENLPMDIISVFGDVFFVYLLDLDVRVFSKQTFHCSMQHHGCDWEHQKIIAFHFSELFPGFQCCECWFTNVMTGLSLVSKYLP